MIRLFKLIFLLPLLVVVACSNDDEPALPELKGEVENGFFTNLLTSSSTHYFVPAPVSTYRKIDGTEEWVIDDEKYLGGSSYPCFLFYNGRLYFSSGLGVYVDDPKYDLLNMLFSELEKAGRVYPRFFFGSTLSFSETTRVLTYVYRGQTRVMNVIQAAGNKFRISSECSYVSAYENGIELQICDFLDSPTSLSENTLKESMFFNSWNEIIDYIITDAEDFFGAEYRLFEDGPTVEEIRKFYSDSK